MIATSLRRSGAWSPGLLLVALLGSFPAVAPAQPSGQPQPADDLLVHVIAFKHQSAREAMMLVLPMLSSRGTAELRAEGNTLVLRDTVAALSRILPVLYGFDHPAREVDVELWLIRASGGRSEGISAPPPAPSNVPPELLRSLLENLPYRRYDLVAQSRVKTREGQRVTFDLAAQYAVRFRLGTIVGERRLRLNDFEVMQQGPRQATREAPRSLLRSHLNLWLDQSMVLALAAGENSPSALMVVVRCRAAEEDG